VKTQNILIRIVAAVFVCAATQLSAGLPRIEPIASFGMDPALMIETRPQSINGNGDIVGYTLDHNQDDAYQGFVRPRHGTHFTFVHPDEKPGSTVVLAINDSGLIAGQYSGRPNGEAMTLGFFLSGDTYTDVVIPGSTDTRIQALNDAGAFAGTADFQGPLDLYHPYLSVAGTVTLFSLPGTFTAVGGMNNLNQIVGYYFGERGHGYLRDADGTLTYPIDYPGALYTKLNGINDKGWMVGSYIDTESISHGIFLTSPTRFVVFDYPGASFTELTGINDQGMICGYYVLSFGVVYGFVARVVLP
jgi:hypothetical protein